MSFKKVSKLYGFISKLYLFFICVLVVSVFISIYEYYSYAKLPEIYYSDDDFLLSDIFTILIGFVQFITVIILSTNFFRFIHRVSKNLQFQFNEKLIASPGWSIGYFFIPIVSLFKPYQVVKNILDVVAKGEERNKSLPGFWWAFWLISRSIGNIVLRLGISDSEVTSLMYIVSDSIDIILYIVEYKLVKTIAEFYINNYEQNTFVDIDQELNF